MGHRRQSGRAAHLRPAGRGGVPGCRAGVGRLLGVDRLHFALVATACRGRTAAGLRAVEGEHDVDDLAAAFSLRTRSAWIEQGLWQAQGGVDSDRIDVKAFKQIDNVFLTSGVFFMFRLFKRFEDLDVPVSDLCIDIGGVAAHTAAQIDAQSKIRHSLPQFSSSRSRNIEIFYTANDCISGT